MCVIVLNGEWESGLIQRIMIDFMLINPLDKPYWWDHGLDGGMSIVSSIDQGPPFDRRRGEVIVDPIKSVLGIN